MSRNYWLIALLLVILVGWYFLHQPLTLESGSAATSTPTLTSTPGTSGEDLTVAGVEKSIVGTWESTTAPAIFTFTAKGTFTSQVGVGAKEQGTWKLYTSVSAPSDLSNLVLEPSHVFIRLTIAGKNQDFLVWKADAISLAMGPIGQGGSITFSRSK